MDLISQGRENTGDCFPSLHIDRGAAEVDMATETIKPVFSRPRESYPRKSSSLALNCLSTRKARNESFVFVRRELLQVQCWYRYSVTVTERVLSIFFHLHLSSRR